MKGYIVKNEDGSVWVHASCPRWVEQKTRDGTTVSFWVSVLGGSFQVNPDDFPDVTTEDRPREIDISITLTDTFVSPDEIPDLYEKVIPKEEENGESEEISENSI